MQPRGTLGLRRFPNEVQRTPRSQTQTAAHQRARRGSLPVICEFGEIGPTKAAQRSSGWRDLGPVEFGGHFCAHKFEKDANASLVVKMHKSTKGFSERSRQDPDLLADLEIVIRANDPEILSHYRFDDAVWHRYRLFDAHDQRCDAEGAVNCAPAIS